MFALQVEDLRREALQNQRELLQEKTKVKALSEGMHILSIHLTAAINSNALAHTA
jgi:hypothetical protein